MLHVEIKASIDDSHFFSINTIPLRKFVIGFVSINIVSSIREVNVEQGYLAIPPGDYSPSTACYNSDTVLLIFSETVWVYTQQRR